MGDLEIRGSGNPVPYWISLLGGIALALLALHLARTRLLIDLNKAAYGAETQGYVSTTGSRIQCEGIVDSDSCLEDYEAAGRKPGILWLGNSQLAAINRSRPGDVNAPFLLHQALASRGNHVLTYAMPNANLSEHALVIEALAARFRPEVIVLPVVYDDLREEGIRATVADMAKPDRIAFRMRQSGLWPQLGPLLRSDPSTQANGQKTATDATVQAKSERALTGWLNANSALFQDRLQLRGMLSFAVHVARNKLLGIHSSSKRRVDPAMLAQRMQLLEVMLRRARQQGQKAIVYIPPYRRDIDGPYVEAEYQQFKKLTALIARRQNARFADLEALVPGAEWATVTDPLFGTREPDFMHFTAEGHRRLAMALNAELRTAGF